MAKSYLNYKKERITIFKKKFIKLDGAKIDVDKIVDAISKTTLRKKAKTLDELFDDMKFWGDRLNLNNLHLFIKAYHKYVHTADNGETMTFTKQDELESDYIIEDLIDSILESALSGPAPSPIDEIIFDAIDGTGDEELMEAYCMILDKYGSIEKFVEYYQSLDNQFEGLKILRKVLRFMRKLKTARVSAMIKTAWLNRNRGSGRSKTSAVIDKMLLSIPTPPTSVVANSTLGYGGVEVAV